MKTIFSLVACLIGTPFAFAEELEPEYAGATLPTNCTVTRREYEAQGVTFVSHKIKPEGAAWSIYLLTEKRNLPSDRQKLVSLKAFYNQTIQNLRNQGFSDLIAEPPDLADFDPDEPTVIPVRMQLRQKEYFGEVRVTFTNMGHVAVVLADSMELLATARSVCEQVVPQEDQTLAEMARKQVIAAPRVESRNGRFSVKIPELFKATAESTHEGDGTVWLSAKSTSVTVRIGSISGYDSAAQFFEDEMEFQSKYPEPSFLGGHELTSDGLRFYRLDKSRPQFMSGYVLDLGDRVFMVEAKYQDLLAYCSQVPLIDEIVGTIRLP